MFEVKIFTLYPDLYPGPLNTGIYKKAQEKKIWNLKVINIRNYATDKHGSVDDTPFGGGSGMLLRPDVVASALDSNINSNDTNGCVTMNCSLELIPGYCLSNICFGSIRTIHHLFWSSRSFEMF